MTKRYHGYMTTLLLLTDVPHLGKQHQLVEVEESKVIDILAKRQALCATPLVRERFAEQIRLAHSPQ
jgi:rRNA pseudouridine-1189 N-methylase Emg1 (Nep1/Mra1 family)